MNHSPISSSPSKLNHSPAYDPDHDVICDLSLMISGPERIVIAGLNGSAKTTLLKIITGQILPQRGQVEVVARFGLRDQHRGLLDPVRTLRDSFVCRNPSADGPTAHAALARFGFHAADALRSAGELSGGERLRACPACALEGKPPPMQLILVEPTNHLDLDGIAALEAALAAYDGAVLVVRRPASMQGDLLWQLAP